jgi:hypothetical protein
MIPVLFAVAVAAAPAARVSFTAAELASSAAVCAWQDKRARTVEEIRTEQRYAAELGGVVDMAKLYRLQRQVRLIDEEVVRLRATLKTEGLRTAPCSHPFVAKLAMCRRFWAENGDLYSGWTRHGVCADASLDALIASIRDPL